MTPTTPSFRLTGVAGAALELAVPAPVPPQAVASMITTANAVVSFAIAFGISPPSTLGNPHAGAGPTYTATPYSRPSIGGWRQIPGAHRRVFVRRTKISLEN